MSLKEKLQQIVATNCKEVDEEFLHFRDHIANELETHVNTTEHLDFEFKILYLDNRKNWPSCLRAYFSENGFTKVTVTVVEKRIVIRVPCEEWLDQ